MDEAALRAKLWELVRSHGVSVVARETKITRQALHGWGRGTVNLTLAKLQTVAAAVGHSLDVDYTLKPNRRAK